MKTRPQESADVKTRLNSFKDPGEQFVFSGQLTCFLFHTNTETKSKDEAKKITKKLKLGVGGVKSLRGRVHLDTSAVCRMHADVTNICHDAENLFFFLRL